MASSNHLRLPRILLASPQLTETLISGCAFLHWGLETLKTVNWDSLHDIYYLLGITAFHCLMPSVFKIIVPNNFIWYSWLL